MADKQLDNTFPSVGKAQPAHMGSQSSAPDKGEEDTNFISLDVPGAGTFRAYRTGSQ